MALGDGEPTATQIHHYLLLGRGNQEPVQSCGEVEKEKISHKPPASSNTAPEAQHKEPDFAFSDQDQDPDKEILQRL